MGSVHGFSTGLSPLWYQPSIYSSQRAATTAPVEPVKRVPPVVPGHKTPIYPVPAQLPEIRQGIDPAEMAVRGRIQYLSKEEVNDMIQNHTGAMENKAASSAGGVVDTTKSAAEVMAEAECQTCKERKYQDGSNDPGVSFKTPTNLTPEEAATAVRRHEMEHVVREQAKANREDRKVVQQTVTLHTEICPECGDTYIAGGVTRTLTKANPTPEQQNQQHPVSGFEAVA